MKNVSYRYSVCHADRVTLDVGETLTFPRGSAARSLGVLVLQGRLESTEIETGDVLLRVESVGNAHYVLGRSSVRFTITYARSSPLARSSGIRDDSTR